MHDPFLVRGLEGQRDLPRDRERLGYRQGTALEPLLERVAVHELEHERADAVSFLDAEDGADVGVVQRRQRSCFAIESRQTLRMPPDLLRENLDRDLTTQSWIAGLVD